ncbi:MAG: hypothetical protein AB7V22_00260 [Kiritimatiellia bacterium]
MHPTLRDGDVVTIQPRPPGTLRRGSVVLYRICARLVLHRYTINEKRTNQVFAVGDAALAGGDWIPAADVLGVAQSVAGPDRIRRLDTRFARWAGLARFYLRPLRRLAVAIHKRRFRFSSGLRLPNPNPGPHKPSPYKRGSRRLDI